jgi:hypothetical protein
MQVYRGSCLITVTGVDADWPQRAVVRIRNGAEVVLRGAVGEQYQVDAPSWELLLQHQCEGVWRDNVRAVVGRWTSVGGVEQQVIRSKDRDWAHHSPREINLVLRLERRGAEEPSRSAVAAPAGPRAVPTQSGTESAAHPTVQRTRTSTTVGRPVPSTPTSGSAPTTSSGGGAAAPMRTSTAGGDVPW